MHYQQLSGEGLEIRVLTIRPLREAENDNTVVECTLSHVQLIAGHTNPTKIPNSSRSDRTWPEAQQFWDIQSLFNHKKHPLAEDRTRRDPSKPQDGTAQHPPLWRYSWGDYAALSYVWGAQTPAQTIYINREPFLVGENLYRALKQLRKCERVRQGLRLWIDAISINQDDLTERSKQVARMRDVYESAWQVITWLGLEVDNSDLALTAVYWLAGRASCAEPLEGFYSGGFKVDAWPVFVIPERYESPLKKDVYKALFYFFTRQYWHRLWILQEIAMARDDAPILCGTRCTSWSDLFAACKLISQNESRFGRDIATSTSPRGFQDGSNEFARDRVIEQRETTSERMWLRLLQIMKLQHHQRSLESCKSASQLIELFALSMEANVTDQKDRVYGILGMKAFVLGTPPAPDYTLSLEQIYETYSRCLLSEGHLEILRLVNRSRDAIDSGKGGGRQKPSHPAIAKLREWLEKATKSTSNFATSCPHQLPSWVVCWACPSPPTAHLKATYSADKGISSRGNQITMSADTLIVRGIMCDTIISLSSFHPMEQNETYPFSSPDAASTISAYGDWDATREALWRTIVANSTPEGQPCPAHFDWLLTPRIWEGGVGMLYTNGFGLDDVMARNRELMLCGYALEKIVHGPNKPRSWMNRNVVWFPTPEQLAALSWAMNVLAWRRLVGTDRGRMGLAPTSAQAGDMIVAIIGCSMPIVLRKVGNAWRVIGECYLHGVMEGEMSKEVESGSVAIEEYSIC